MEEKKYKKFYRKVDEHLNGKIEAKHGKQNNQKMKPYLVLQYLLKNTDENHTQSAYDIMEYLGECGISSERRSIYSDIEEINKINLMIEQDYLLEEAEEVLSEGYDEDKLILYDKSKKGFYIRQRHFDFDDIRLLAECVYSSKFISEKQSKKLIDVVCDFVSEHQAEKIKHNAFLSDRVKTNNDRIYGNIMTINDAMSMRIEGESHTPEKISFKYMKYSIDNLNNQIERRKGEKYIVSPFQLLINDGNYYLLAYDEKQKMKTFRVDRMKDVRFTNIPREGDEVFYKIDLKSYTKRVFSMYGGKEQIITLKFITPLLDTVIDRFGTNGVKYSKSDENHFSITARVEVSDQFYGWLLGFGKRVQIVSPPEAKEEFAAYLDKIREMY